MLRCKICGGRAHPALPHLHGTLDPLCYDCTQRVLAKRQEKENVERFLDQWKSKAGGSTEGKAA